MMYLDSSVLIKRYFVETGSDRVTTCFTGADIIYTSSLSYAEVLAAVGRRLRERLISTAEADSVQQDFLLDWNKHLHEVSLERSVLALMPNLFRTQPLRGSDGVHLASAMCLQDLAKRSGQAFSFGASDEKLCRAAEAMGLEVFNPEKP